MTLFSEMEFMDVTSCGICACIEKSCESQAWHEQWFIPDIPFQKWIQVVDDTFRVASIRYTVILGEVRIFKTIHRREKFWTSALTGQRARTIKFA